jgi:hypothetical protein
MVVTADAPRRQITYLHLLVWDFFAGLGVVRPRRAGEVVHHLQGKLDNRIASLGVGSRRAHAYVHRTKKQCFSQRRHLDLTGFYSPRRPSPVRDRPDLVAGARGPGGDLRGGGDVLCKGDLLAAADDLSTTSGPAPSTGGASPPRQKIRTTWALRDYLAPRLDAVRAKLKKAFPTAQATKGVKASEWRRPETFCLRLRRPPALTRGGAVLVGLMVLERMDRESLGRDLRLEVEIDPGVVEKMLADIAVDQAIRDWVRHRTLPHELLPRRR